MSWLVGSQVHVQRYTIWPVPHSRVTNPQRWKRRNGHVEIQVATRHHDRWANAPRYIVKSGLLIDVACCPRPLTM
jgi:hypothetical protein